MDNMYDKLGEMLNNVLETGKLPQSTKTKDNSKIQDKDQISVKIEKLPESIQEAFRYLECTPEMSQEEVRKSYHKKLKSIHPDKNTIQESENEYKNIHYTVEKLGSMYKILNNYYTQL